MENVGGSMAISFLLRLDFRREIFISNLSPYLLQLISTIQSRKQESCIQPGDLSEDYLKRCLERKGGLQKDTIRSFREKWGKCGKKQVKKIKKKLDNFLCPRQKE